MFALADVFLGFATGLATGVLTVYIAQHALARFDLARVRKLERRVDELYRNLACGQGYVGCGGGPRCSSDHK